MTAQELWTMFASPNGLNSCDYDAWAFGDQPDLLAHLVATGEKTATASAYPLYEMDGEPLPEVGEYNIILDTDDNAVCITQTTSVTVVPFHAITTEHARKEGEGDKSLAYWTQVHKAFFTACMEEAGLEFTPDMKVVCEEFTVVFKP